jgi:hypothetical protein
LIKNEKNDYEIIEWNLPLENVFSPSPLLKNLSNNSIFNNIFKNNFVFFSKD